MEEMLICAVKEFEATKQYQLLREKLDQMDRDCNMMLTPCEKEFAIECFALISEVNEQERYFVYHKGLRDGVKLLKWLGLFGE